MSYLLELGEVLLSRLSSLVGVRRRQDTQAALLEFVIGVFRAARGGGREAGKSASLAAVGRKKGFGWGGQRLR